MIRKKGEGGREGKRGGGEDGERKGGMGRRERG